MTSLVAACDEAIHLSSPYHCHNISVEDVVERILRPLILCYTESQAIFHMYIICFFKVIWNRYMFMRLDDF
jgi:hypothetical protein